MISPRDSHIAALASMGALAVIATGVMLHSADRLPSVSMPDLDLFAPTSSHSQTAQPGRQHAAQADTPAPITVAPSPTSPLACEVMAIPCLSQLVASPHSPSATLSPVAGGTPNATGGSSSSSGTQSASPSNAPAGITPSGQPSDSGSPTPSSTPSTTPSTSPSTSPSEPAPSASPSDPEPTVTPSEDPSADPSRSVPPDPSSSVVPPSPTATTVP